MKSGALVTQWGLGFVLLLMQESLFAEFFRQLFGHGLLSGMRINFLFLLCFYFGLFRDFAEGLLSAFLFGLLAGILYPYFFSFYPTYAVLVFLSGFLASQFFLVRQSRLTWVLVLGFSLVADGGILYLVQHNQQFARLVSADAPEILIQALINVAFFPLVKKMYHKLHYHFYATDPQRAMDEISFSPF